MIKQPASPARSQLSPRATSGTVFAGNLVDVLNRRIMAANVLVEHGRIARIERRSDPVDRYLLPGFIDAHVHIESSLLVPAQFARPAVVHGTVATVSDPHEIANVLGTRGVEFMLDSAARVPLKVFFGAPSCVPATPFETSGAALRSTAVAELLSRPDIYYLSEMMNYPGVLARDSEVLAKIAAAHAAGKPVDGHAPGLRGEDAARYLQAGITTDHECTCQPEALDKLQSGAKILIREGSAARNFDALYALIDQFPDACMLCSDDKHPDGLLHGHINELVRRSVARGLDLWNVLRCASVNPVQHYGLPVGLLREGDPADFIEVGDLADFPLLRTVIEGRVVAEEGRCCFPADCGEPVNLFRTGLKQSQDFRLAATSPRVRVIEVVDGELLTRSGTGEACLDGGNLVSNVVADVLKCCVVNRYQDVAPQVAFVRNFGLRHGAIASSVAHDSHNIVAVGTRDEDLCTAVNLVIENQGGLAVAAGPNHEVLPLPIAGLMSAGDAEDVGRRYATLEARAKALGSRLGAPLMMLSFLALLVIPELKLSDRGLFDARRFEFVDVVL